MLSSSAHAITVLPTPPPPTRVLVPRLPRVQSLSDLSGLLSALERQERPDVLVPLRDLAMNDDGTMQVPGEGAFALTVWARRQLSERLGIRWDRWFSNVTDPERAAEVNLRLSRSSEGVRLRTAEVTDPDTGRAGTVLRAFVSPRYQPFSDAMIAGLLAEALGGADYAVQRVFYTDMTVSYAVSVGKPFVPGGDAKVGDLQGSILVRNSGVGYASLSVIAYFVRLVCLNGMAVPVKDPVLLAAVHRGSHERAIRERLAENASRLGGFLTEGAARLLETRRMPIENREEVFLEILRRARVPQKQLPALETAYAAEPEPSAFGIAQAVTRAAQLFPSETRFDLERAASAYITDGAAA
jgi:hypothetical protein